MAHRLSIDAPIVQSHASASRWGFAAGVLAIMGATVGAALDMLHVATRTTSYPHPDVLGIAWWVFPEFAAAAIAIGLARPIWERILDRRTPAASSLEIAGGRLCFVLCYALSGLLPLPWSTTALVLAVLAFAAWGVSDRSGLGVFLGVCTALIGTTTEIILIRYGFFRYERPDLLGVAGWLPWIYVAAGCAVGQLGKRLVDGRP